MGSVSAKRFLGYERITKGDMFHPLIRLYTLYYIFFVMIWRSFTPPVSPNENSIAYPHTWANCVATFFGVGPPPQV